eukprot:TRINITY_DN13602_c0_g2_i1.p1 TRINITY_DN13602_c0_g2~~TRINITY_DN13602_c0_g2_i1.p1  ORF type:complete len:173 (-),score=8.60 TRINITY_DN13602_c0_g2_i1:32-550(-)
MISRCSQLPLAMFLHSRKVIDFLHGIDISRLQGIDVSTRRFITRSEVWRTIINGELPQLEVADDLWCDLQLTLLIVKCFGLLSHAVISTKCVISITNAVDLELLEACLRKAATTKISHVASGGRAASYTPHNIPSLCAKRPFSCSFVCKTIVELRRQQNNSTFPRKDVPLTC